MEIRLERTIWPVGHGAFYTERFMNEHNDVLFTAAYDCGAKSVGRVQNWINEVTNRCQEQIDILFISHLHFDHICGLYHLLHTNVVGSTNLLVQKVILPHLKQEDILEAIIYNAIVTSSNGELVEENAQIQSLLISIARGEFREQAAQVGINEGEPEVIISLDEERANNRLILPANLAESAEITIQTLGQSIWRYKPVYYLPDDKCERLKNKIDTLMNGNLLHGGKKIDWDALRDYLRTLKRTKRGGLDCSDLQKEYNSVFPKTKYEQAHNNYSMPVYSGPINNARLRETYPLYWYKYGIVARCNDVLFRDYLDILSVHTAHCLYTGDFEANDPIKLNESKQVLGLLWAKVGLLQIPHHISDSNYNPDLYDHRMLCFGNVDDSGDRSFTFDIWRRIMFNHHCPALIITDRNKPQRFIYIVL